MIEMKEQLDIVDYKGTGVGHVNLEVCSFPPCPLMNSLDKKLIRSILDLYLIVVEEEVTLAALVLISCNVQTSIP